MLQITFNGLEVRHSVTKKYTDSSINLESFQVCSTHTHRQIQTRIFVLTHKHAYESNDPSSQTCHDFESSVHDSLFHYSILLTFFSCLPLSSTPLLIIFSPISTSRYLYLSHLYSPLFTPFYHAYLVQVDNQLPDPIAAVVLSQTPGRFLQPVTRLHMRRNVRFRYCSTVRLH